MTSTPINGTFGTGNLAWSDELNKNIITEVARSSFLSRLAVEQPVDLAAGGEVFFEDFVGVQVATEGIDKIETNFSQRVTRVQRSMLQGTKTVSIQALEMAADHGVALMEAVAKEIATGFGSDIDIIATHGTDPVSGAASLDFTEVIANAPGQKVVDVDLAGRVDYALREALTYLMTNRKKTTGIVVTPEFFSKLAYLEDAHGHLLYPWLTAEPIEKANFDSRPLIVSDFLNRKDHRGNVPTKHAFLAGDFNQIKYGLEVKQPKILTAGNPTGQFDLGGKNRIALRQEAWLELLFGDRGAFAVGKIVP